MSLADKLASVVRTAEDAPEESYECKACGETFDLDRQTCPACDGADIDRTDWDGLVSE